MRGDGYCVLRNSAAEVPHTPGVWLVGLDYRFVDRSDIGKALHVVPDEAMKILLVHEPDYADEAPPGFAFQLSGHSHGVPVRLPCLSPFDLPYLGRRYMKDSAKLQTTRFM